MHMSNISIPHFLLLLKVLFALVHLNEFVKP